MQTCRTLELVPNPAFLIQSMRHIGYTLETALADVIDNSVAANASCISVQYRWNSGEPWLAIIDNGSGMDSEKLEEAMRFGGQSSPATLRSANDLGRFGLGLKTASLSQCKWLIVISKQNTNINACAWDIDFLTKAEPAKWNALVLEEKILKDDSIISPLLDNFRESPSGTIVIWRKFDTIPLSDKKKDSEKKFSEMMVRATEHIGLVFHRFLAPDSGKKAIKIDFNGVEVEAYNPFGLAVASRRELTAETITIQNCKIEIQPYVLSHGSKISKQDYQKFGGEEGYLQNQGFYVYRNRRLIVKGTWFRLIPKTELTKLLRVRIDIPNSLDQYWQLDVKKSQAHPPQAILDRLREVIQHIANEGRKVYSRRGTPTLSQLIHIWRREISDGKISYVLNEEHPFVKNLVDDGQGNIDRQKLSFLRIISGAFPAEIFHYDANNDDNTQIVPIARKEEAEHAVSALIRSLHNCGLGIDAIKTQLEQNELPISKERLSELIMEEFYDKC